MSTPIETMLSAVDWTPTGQVQTGDLPVATHEGVLHLFGKSLRCYRLSSGESVFDADDFIAFWNDANGGDA